LCRIKKRRFEASGFKTPFLLKKVVFLLKTETIYGIWGLEG